MGHPPTPGRETTHLFALLDTKLANDYETEGQERMGNGCMSPSS